MGYRTVLVDALWDTQVGYDKIEELAAYAKQKNVGLYCGITPMDIGMMPLKDLVENE